MGKSYIWTVFFMKMRILAWLLTVALMAAGLYAGQTLLEQRALAEKTVRLHVVANSDSVDDQAQKLRVRDAVLEKVGQLTDNCATAAQAREIIGAHLEEITQAAQAVLDAEHSGYQARATLGVEDFETRYYDTFTLPAGEYPALRVNIGNAHGHNWWCVVFPSLCTAATSQEVAEYAQTGGFDADETQLITGGEEEYELRFKTLEWLQKLRDWLR